MRNVIQQPNEEKFRRLNITNERLKPILGNKPGIDIMREIGWEVDEDICFLPSSVKLEFQKHVGKIIDARDYYTKEIERAKKSAKREKYRARSEIESDTTHSKLESVQADPSTTNLGLQIENKSSEASPNHGKLEPIQADPATTKLDLQIESESLEADARRSSSTTDPRSSSTFSTASHPVSQISPSVGSTEASQPTTTRPSAAPAEHVQESQTRVSSNALLESASLAQRRANNAQRMACNLGHLLCQAKLKPYQGFVHRRECSLCDTRIMRGEQWMRCEQCRLSICAVGKLRDTYCICSACAQPSDISCRERVEVSTGNQNTETSPQVLAGGMSDSIRALRQNRYQHAK